MSDNSNYIKVKTTDHQTVYINKSTIAGIEPVVGGSRTSEHVRVFAGGYKWLVDESPDVFLARLGISIEEDEGPAE